MRQDLRISVDMGTIQDCYNSDGKIKDCRDKKQAIDGQGGRLGLCDICLKYRVVERSPPEKRYKFTCPRLGTEGEEKIVRVLKTISPKEYYSKYLCRSREESEPWPEQ